MQKMMISTFFAIFNQMLYQSPDWKRYPVYLNSLFMKNLMLFIFVCLSGDLLLNAQQSWQKFSDLSVKTIAENFKSPPPEYGMILWWGWDGPMTDTVIKRDLDRIKAMGFSGVMVEAGYGMTAKYLSQEWFKLVGIAVEEAKLRGMKIWIEDEGKYPSGFAGGKFSAERPDLKMQGLVITEKIDPKQGENISRKLPSYTISAVAFNSIDSTSKRLDISSGELNWQVPEGNWRIFLAGHRFRSSVTRSVNNPVRGKDTTASLFDYLNPLATKQFIAWTHEEYKKGYDITPYLASFFVPKPDIETRLAKADYWDVWSELFRDNFFKVQADWCRENNIEYIVHLNHEDQLPGLVKSSGDFFRNMRYVGVPGVDAIWSQIWMDHEADYPKLASSAAHIFGKPRAFTESFAAYTYRPTVLQAKWVLDYQLVRGINFVQIMFMSASTGRNDPAPPSINLTVGTSQVARKSSFFMSDTFPPVAKYINRASYLLSLGRPASTTAIYFPTLSLWYGDNDSNTSCLNIAKQLLEKQYDFDFIDEQALTTLVSIEKGSFKNLSGQTYNTVIIPSISVISKAALQKLEDFSADGGKVIFMGKLPTLITEKSFLKAWETKFILISGK